MTTLFINDPSVSRSPSITSPTRAFSKSKRASWAPSNRTSAVSSSPSECLGITSSQQATPAGTPELQKLGRGRSFRVSVASIGDNLLASLKSRDDETKAPNARRRSLTDALWPPKPTVVEKPLGSPIAEEATMSRSTLTMTHAERRNASTDVLSLQGAFTRRNSLETEMNVDPEDQEALATALELLSLNPQPSTLGQPNGQPTLRTSTIKDLDFPESTTRALQALVTNAFTPAQLPAARSIQKFMHDNPDTPIPKFLVTKEIAEIYGDYGWCLIGKCGLERISYKLARLASTSNITDEDLERDQTRRHIETLCGHIRDRHFESMPFQCRLCPASYITQDGLNRHWMTHPLGDFACPTCGEIFVSDGSLQRHRHSKHSKGNITAKFLRLLAKAVPLK